MRRATTIATTITAISAPNQISEPPSRSRRRSRSPPGPRPTCPPPSAADRCPRRARVRSSPVRWADPSGAGRRRAGADHSRRSTGSVDALVGAPPGAAPDAAGPDAGVVAVAPLGPARVDAAAGPVGSSRTAPAVARASPATRTPVRRPCRTSIPRRRRHAPSRCPRPTGEYCERRRPGRGPEVRPVPRVAVLAAQAVRPRVPADPEERGRPRLPVR